MSLDTYDVRRAVHGYFGAEDSDFDEWLESHDAEVRNEAIIARDTRTPAELIQAAWEAAHLVPKGSVIPAGTPSLSRPPHGETEYFPIGIDHDFTVREGDEIRTLDPLPPLIPDNCDLVWAGNPDRRVVWHRDPSNPDRWNGYDVAGHAANFHRDNLIDPKPVPEEES